MQKIQIIFLSIILSSVSSLAFSAKRGPYVKLNYVNFNIEDRYIVDDKFYDNNFLGLAGSFGWKFPVHKKLSIAPELLYTVLGKDSANLDNNLKTETEIKPYLSYKIEATYNAFDYFDVFVNFGKSAGVEIEHTTISDTGNSNIKEEFDFTEYGLGVVYNYNKQLGLIASYNIVKIEDSNSDANIIKFGVILSF